MDYEKKYKEALEWARKVMQGKVGFVLDEVLDKFPELKEIEDEKMLRVLREGFNILDKDDEWYSGITNGQILAWLEKQVQKKSDVEPKFREGEWLCENEPNNYARFIQILEIVNVQGKDRYRISRDIHKDEDVVEFGFVEKYYHKFDIKDAKEGDVLASRSPFIYGKQCPYGGLNWCNDKFIKASNFIFTDSPVHPATKEQRELLFQKMKEAGYEWNAENKQLKKIERNPTDEEMKELLHTEYEKGRADAIAEMQNALSEDDEREMAVLEAYIRSKDWSDRHIDRALGIVDELANKLKSLRLQNVWKPSDGQMESITCAVRKMKESACYDSELVWLLNDLKKLRNE